MHVLSTLGMNLNSIGLYFLPHLKFHFGFSFYWWLHWYNLLVHITTSVTSISPMRRLDQSFPKSILSKFSNAMKHEKYSRISILVLISWKWLIVHLFSTSIYSKFRVYIDLKGSIINRNPTESSAPFWCRKIIGK